VLDGTVGYEISIIINVCIGFSIIMWCASLGKVKTTKEKIKG
jgi:hypothetical protein